MCWLGVSSGVLNLSSLFPFQALPHFALSFVRPSWGVPLTPGSVPGVGPDQGEVGEAHGPVPDRRGSGTWLTHKAARLPGE